MRRGDLQLIVQLSCFKFGYTKLRKTAGQSASLSEEVEVHLAILVMAWHSLANRDLLLDQQRPQHSLRAQKLFWEYWRIGSSWKWQFHITILFVQPCKHTCVCLFLYHCVASGSLYWLAFLSIIMAIFPIVIIVMTAMTGVDPGQLGWAERSDRSIRQWMGSSLASATSDDGMC